MPGGEWTATILFEAKGNDIVKSFGANKTKIGLFAFSKIVLFKRNESMILYDCVFSWQPGQWHLQLAAFLNSETETIWLPQ